MCARALAETRTFAPSFGDGYWVAVRAGFTCNSCRFLAPLDGMDTDGAAECAHCGLRQRLEPDVWIPALEHAHAIGDLAGPHPEGRTPHPTIWIGSDNPHRAVGERETFKEIASEQLKLEACPGHPTCPRCRDLLNVHVSEDGAVRTQCPRCSEQATFALPPAVRSLYEGIVAVISEDERTDRPRARTQMTSPGVIALACPSCGAPLSLASADQVQVCGYCRNACLVPHRSLLKALAASPTPAVWWMFFRGHSPLRAELNEPPVPPLLVDGLSGTSKAKLEAMRQKIAHKKDMNKGAGLYEAPEAPGWNVPQMLFTTALALIALGIGYFLYLVMADSFAARTLTAPRVTEAVVERALASS